MPRALATVQTPDSFADEEYYGVNAFILVNDKGERHAVRYLLAPEKLVHLAPAEAAKQAPDFLIDELPARIERGAVTFHLKAQLASPGDSTKDASTPWPNSDEVVELGVLTIDKAARDSLEAQKKLLFLPGQLTDGIEAGHQGRSDASTDHRYQKNQAGRASNRLPSATRMESEMLKLGQVFRTVQFSQ
jgi:catalase